MVLGTQTLVVCHDLNVQMLCVSIKSMTVGSLGWCPLSLPLLTCWPLQVQSYMEHYCNNSTDRRILLMFMDICSELNKLCQHFEALHSGTPVTNSLLEKCKTLVSQSNDLSSLRAK